MIDEQWTMTDEKWHENNNNTTLTGMTNLEQEKWCEAITILSKFYYNIIHNNIQLNLIQNNIHTNFLSQSHTQSHFTVFGF
jgi:hypothetical protein